MKKLLSYAAIVAMFGTAACTPDLDTLEDTQAKGGDAFTQALTDDYRILAEENKERADYGDAEMFARKGLGASGGEMIQPIDPFKTNVPADRIQELSQARAALAELFAQGIENKLPELMAAAQVNFDCWVEEVNDYDSAAAEQCRADFNEALIRIHDALEVQAPELFLVFFNSGSAAIDPAGMEVLAATAATFKDTGANEILVLGYTDLVGSAKSNIQLSQKRAHSTKDALVAMGVPAERIVAIGQGESNPLVNTPKADRENRRVEIIIR